MRVLTALVMTGLCLFAGMRGWSIADFAATQSSRQNNVDDLRRWIAIPGVTSAALQALLARSFVSDVEGARQRALSLTDLLSIRPVSSEEWLSLAEMRLVVGQPQDEVQSALLMSSVAGPNEDYLMWQRGLFGLFIWQSLPAEARGQTIRDFAGALRGVPLNEHEIGTAKYLLTEKSDETRSEIVGLLKSEGVTKTEFDRIGL